MINNLFSVFDPASSSFNLSWILLILIIPLATAQTWVNNSVSNNASSNFLSFLFNEVAFTLNNTNNSEMTYIIILFFTIFLINVTALFPQVFSLTSHLTITLPLALLGWLTINLFGWINNTNHMLAHLVPQGTPGALISFIVLIELTSNLIRPITLCVRLTANLIAGHLLITLLGNAMISLSVSLSIFLIPVPLILTILETAVAIIQSYVFITLITLYVTEVN